MTRNFHWPKLKWSYTRTITLIGTLLYLGILIAPIFMSFYYSLTNLNLLKSTNDFVGLSNYQKLISDPTFKSTLLFTLGLSLSVTLAVNFLGLIIAILLNNAGRFFAFLRTVFFVPQVLSGVVIGFIWGVMLSSRNGIVNTLLQQIGIIADNYEIAWLGDPQLAKFSVGLVVTWQLMGFCVVVYLAALQGIPVDLMDAARVDGANYWQTFRHVVFPLLAPGMTVNVVLVLIMTLKLYDIPVVLTSGGPGGATESMAIYIIRIAFTANKTGYASAMSVVLFLMIGLISVSLAAFLRNREVEY